MKKTLVNVAIVVASITIALLIGELAIRLAQPDQIVTDPVLGRRAVDLPGWDANGWKNPRALSKADIVAIGDSQTEGDNAGVEETWPFVLGALSSTTVYQTALGGFGPVQYAVLGERALELDPRAVIVGLYLGNDVLDAYSLTYGSDAWTSLRDPDFRATSTDVDQYDFRTIMSTGLDPSSLSYNIYQARLWVRAHSKLYATLGNATRKLRELIGVAKTVDEKLEDVEEYAKAHPDVVYYFDEPGISTVLSPA
jgi:hypothetical protein